MTIHPESVKITVLSAVNALLVVDTYFFVGIEMKKLIFLVIEAVTVICGIVLVVTGGCNVNVTTSVVAGVVGGIIGIHVFNFVGGGVGIVAGIGAGLFIAITGITTVVALGGVSGIVVVGVFFVVHASG